MWSWCVETAHLTLSIHPHTSGVISAGNFVGKNGMCDVELPHHEKITVLTPAAVTETLVALLEDIKPVTYIATGPCTNLARVLTALEERATDVFEDIFVMGGAFTEAGNTGPAGRNSLPEGFTIRTYRNDDEHDWPSALFSSIEKSLDD